MKPSISSPSAAGPSAGPASTSATPRTSLALVAACAAAAALLRLLSGPPLDLWMLVWLAPIPLFALALRPARPGRAGYFGIWFFGSLFWLVTLQGVRLANPALYPGWIALGLYLGAYMPLLVGLTRVAIHELRIPLLLAGPLVWVGLELIRGYALTGLSAVMLGHALVHWPAGFQLVDLGGSYAASGLVAAVAAGLTTVLAWLIGRRSSIARQDPSGAWQGRRAAVAAAAVVVLLVGTWAYGRWRLAQADALASADPLLSVALVQCDTPAIFEFDPERAARSFQNYQQQTEAALRAEPEVDLVVWPESMFTAGRPRFQLAEEYTVPEGAPLSKSEFASRIAAEQAFFDDRARQVQQLAAAASGLSREPPHLIVGSALVEFGQGLQRTYNAGLIYAPAGRLIDWYGKRHLVMFGEYIPLATWLPWLYEIGPLQYGVTPGPRGVAFEIDGIWIAPSICFETMVERVTNGQVRALAQAGKRPDLLINLTNDGWFHGTSVLDYHLRCTQAAAAANRVPILVAANSGITTWVDSSGRVRKMLPRQTEGTLIARPTADDRVSLYARIGDWPARGLAVLCLGLAAVGWRTTRARRGR